jgi:CRP/FNR family transcriptional regulator, cyclic AMP receptor protein
LLPGARTMPQPKTTDSLDISTVLPPPLRALAARGTPRSYRKGTLIIEEGTQGETLYLLLAGRVKAFSSDARGREVVYGAYTAGDYFGEMSLDGGPRSASVLAETACACAVLTRQTLREHIKAEPEFAFELIARVIQRARLATTNLRSMALLDAYGRLARLLDSLAVAQSDGTRVIGERLTHMQIAARIGCSREMVSRLMKDLERGGYIKLNASDLALSKQLPTRW